MDSPASVPCHVGRWLWQNCQAAPWQQCQQRGQGRSEQQSVMLWLLLITIVSLPCLSLFVGFICFLACCYYKLFGEETISVLGFCSVTVPGRGVGCNNTNQDPQPVPIIERKEVNGSACSEKFEWEQQGAERPQRCLLPHALQQSMFSWVYEHNSEVAFSHPIL